MLLKFTLWDEGDRGSQPSVHVNPHAVASVKEWKTHQVATIHLATGEKHNVYDFGDVAKKISEAQNEIAAREVA